MTAVKTINDQNKSAVDKKSGLPTSQILDDKEILAISKDFPYRGFININITGCPGFVMFSNNDDFVAKKFFWNGKNAYEPASLKIWSKLAEKAGIVIDAGSYTGVYSLAAAAVDRRSRVYTFEALDRVAARANVNKLANQYSNITVINAAVSDTEDYQEFNVFGGDSILVTGSSLNSKESVGRSIYEKKLVRVTTIDRELSLVEPAHVGLMKIDVEGSEAAVICGAMKTINEHRPDMLVEILKGSDTKSIEQSLKHIPYNFLSINDRSGKITQIEHLREASGMNDLNTLITTRSLAEVEALL